MGVEGCGVQSLPAVGVTPWEEEKNGEEEGQRYGPGIVEIWEWSGRRYARKGGGKECLGAIRNQALHHAGGGVKD